MAESVKLQLGDQPVEVKLPPSPNPRLYRRGQIMAVVMVTREVWDSSYQLDMDAYLIRLRQSIEVEIDRKLDLIQEPVGTLPVHDPPMEDAGFVYRPKNPAWRDEE